SVDDVRSYAKPLLRSFPLKRESRVEGTKSAMCAGFSLGRGPTEHGVAHGGAGVIEGQSPRQSARPRRGTARGGAGAVPDGSGGDAAERNRGSIRKPLDRTRDRGRAISARRGCVFP